MVRRLTPAYCRALSSSRTRRRFPMIHTRLARCTVSTRCGSNSTATPAMRPRRIPAAARRTLFTWTEVTVGSNVNGRTQPATFSTDYAPGKVTTGEGATAMGFYNVLQGDAPYTKELADNYAISDNYHQPVMGGTGANSIVLGFGDAIWFSDES